MVRFKTVPLRYNSDLERFEEEFELFECSEHEYSKEKTGIGSGDDIEISSKKRNRETKFVKESTDLEKEDLLCCVNIWKNIKFVFKNNTNASDCEIDLNANLIKSNNSLHFILFDESELNRSKCNFKLFWSSEKASKFERNIMIGESDVLYSNLKPRIPYADTRKSLLLLQKGGFLCFLGRIINTKRTRIQRENEQQCEYELSFIVDIYIYLHLNSLNGKLLSRFGGAKSSIKVLLGWLDPDFILPEPESASVSSKTYRGRTCIAGHGGKKKKKRNVNRAGNNNEDDQIAQIKPEELYSVFKDYDISSKRLGSINWKQPFGLVSELRSYQKDAVLFAKRIEDGVRINFEYPPYWHMFTFSEDDYSEKSKTNRFYANMIDGEISLNIPTGGGTFTIRGGCLCDEMGLGKSLEVISLVLINKRKLNNGNSDVLKYSAENVTNKSQIQKEDENLECPCGTKIPGGKNVNIIKCNLCGTKFHKECCISESEYEQKEDICTICENTILEKIHVGATLIVSPASIVDQWYDEINKHVKKGVLRVTKYNGVRYVQNNLKKNILNINSGNNIDKNFNSSFSNYSKEFKNNNTGLSPFSDHIKTRKDVFNYDIVITSYEVLKEEIYHVIEKEDIINKRSMRYKKSYPILPSLLVNINWWRIVLDEAQMTEGYSLVSKMTSKLTCSHKWCVTGTPIVRSCSNDLFGLISNLSDVGFPFVGEVSSNSTFRRYISSLSCSVVLKRDKNTLENEEEEESDSSLDEKYGMDKVVERYKSVGNLVNVLEKLIGLIFYRREMKQVKEELGIPNTFYGNTIMDLSSVERFFYVKQCEIGINNFENTIAKLTDFSNSLTYNKKDVDSIITMLRLACIHPQLGSMGLNHGAGNVGSLISKNTIRRNKQKTKDMMKNDIGMIGNDALTSSLNNGLRIMTMDQILDKLLNKCRIEIEESVRKYVMNTLGLAGLCIYRKETQKAMAYYNQVLDIRNEDRVDTLQQIHTLWNLMDVIKFNQESCTNFDNDSNVKIKIEEMSTECEKLEYRYKNKYIKEYKERLDIYLKSREKTENSDYKVIMDNWWYAIKKSGSSIHQYNSAIDEKDISFQEEVLVDKVNDFLYEYRSSRDGDIAFQLPSINSIQSLLVLFDIKTKEIEENRKRIIVEMDKLVLLNQHKSTLGRTKTKIVGNNVKVKKEEKLAVYNEQEQKKNEKNVGLEEENSMDYSDSENNSCINNKLLDEIISKVYSCKYCKDKESSIDSTRDNYFDVEKERRDEDKNDEYCSLCKMQTYFELLEQCLYTIKKKSKGRIGATSGRAMEIEEDLKPTFDSTFLRDSEIVALIKLISKEVKKSSRTDSKNREIEDSYSNVCDIERMKNSGEKYINKIQISCSSHIKYIELMKSELNSSKACISSIRQLVNSYLEINDCKQRIQVLDNYNCGMRDSGNPVNSSANIIHPNEVFYYIEKYELERLSALGSRRNLKSQQKFLCSLKLHQKLKQIKKNNCQLKDAGNESNTAITELEICPICLNKINNDYSQVLLPCAHLLCIDCYKLVKKSNRIKNQCPKCRSSFSDTNVVLIVPEYQQIDHSHDGNNNHSNTNNRGNAIVRTNFIGDYQNEIDNKINIIGNFGTKIQIIIKHILWILNINKKIVKQNECGSKDEVEVEVKGKLNINDDDKILVFSDFQQVLDIISEALLLNKIVFKKYNGGKSDYHILREFQKGNETRVLICNSLHVGKGVNITSANHIIFVSPLINKSDELQAIGRIIRMGQKKTPHIWNFIVGNSIDEIFFHEYLHLPSLYYSTPSPTYSPSLPSNALNSDKEQHVYVKIANHLVETSKSVSNFS
ncbi:hypothetical protein FG379_000570 [Cryptosporidium bovis]|uniref:uncharacterized protein n=1 Tax=Cryptosporidium bovis TaxID=310047 RepID=UPI00351A322B|nr:hypothetical protein FG379_000570 [Cryptosporidium bovis]